MKPHRTFRGLEAELRPIGGRRFSGVAFLSLWLVFWIVGEGFALSILGWGAWSLLTGQPPSAGRAPLEPGAALAIGLFLLFWTAFWTLGGVLAGREWLRLLFGRDQLIARGDGLEVIHHYGLFRTRTFFPKAHLVRFYVPRPSDTTLAVETLSGVETVSGNGDKAARSEIAATFNAEFQLSPAQPAHGILPRSWRELASLESQPILVNDPVNRRRLAIALWVIFTPPALAAAYLLPVAWAQNTSVALVVIIGAIAALIGWGAWRVSTQRDEWVLGHGQISLQRRRFGRAHPRFTGDALQLREERDSDGDPAFRLSVVQSAALATASLQSKSQYRRDLATGFGEATELVSLGRWLAHRCHLPFADLTTPDAKAEELIQLKQQLAASGRLGQWAARVLEKVAPRVR